MTLWRQTFSTQVRTEFEYICSYCGADPDDSPLVSDAVLGVQGGKKVLPICEDCYGAGRKPKPDGKADQVVLQKERKKKNGGCLRDTF